MWQSKVQAWLQRNDRSAAWLARKAGLNASWMYQTLAGQKRIGRKSLEKLEQVTSMDLGSAQLEMPLAVGEDPHAGR